MTGSNERLRQVMKLLSDEVRERLERHPLGHLVAGRADRLDLTLAVPTALREGSIEKAGSAAEEAVQSAIQSLVAHNARFQPGRVFCLRCQSAGCEHSAPTGSRQVFTGYAGTGAPRFQDMGQWLLQRRDPRVDLVYRDSPQLVATVSTGAELTGELLPAFLQQESGYKLHGQVAVGWYPAPDRQQLAVSFQVISSRAGGRRRFGLNVIGIGPGGGPLEHLYDRMVEVPWAGSVRWAQTVLGSIEHQLERAPQRIEGLINALARRLEKGWRGEERRTRHAKVRHREGDRPTRMALADFAKANPENLLFDTRKDTLVVVGDRGRAHVFSREGKLVTSIRYNPAAIEKRRQNGVWRRAAKEEVEAISTLLSAAGRD
ncbi:MAG TPA: hypothetical protein VFR31_08550 [Thermoanaerobaculia bacterium]|nr:hypothetical protein [Thermoanaerobaculia bacterium]